MSDASRYLDRDDPGRLDHKTCLVTGASRGIGRAIALELARNGATTVVNYRSSRRRAEEVVAAIEDHGERAVTVQADVSDSDAVTAMRDEVHDAVGEVDMLEKVPERLQENIRERIPLDRFATPEDVVGMIRFVASDESAYMTGQVLGINGGLEW